jgi:hypothetical protein
VLAGSVSEALAIATFALTGDEAGLFAVTAAYGLGFSGLIPALSWRLRELFPSFGVWRRVPAAGCLEGLPAAGSPALYPLLRLPFAAGPLFNLCNLAVASASSSFRCRARTRWGNASGGDFLEFVDDADPFRRRIV